MTNEFGSLGGGATCRWSSASFDQTDESLQFIRRIVCPVRRTSTTFDASLRQVARWVTPFECLVPGGGARGPGGALFNIEGHRSEEGLSGKVPPSTAPTCKQQAARAASLLASAAPLFAPGGRRGTPAAAGEALLRLGRLLRRALVRPPLLRPARRPALPHLRRRRVRPDCHACSMEGGDAGASHSR